MGGAGTSRAIAQMKPVSSRATAVATLGFAFPRATSFLYGAFVLGAAAASPALGALLDGLTPLHALPWICALFTALGAAVFAASRRLRS